MTEATVGGVEEEEPPTDLITESTGPGLDLKAGAYHHMDPIVYIIG